MKKFNRVLAMILAIIMTLAVMPLGVFADAWLDTNVESDKSGTTTSTDVTLSLDAAALLSYLKNGDKAELLAGISFGELADAFTREELNGIFPGAKLEEIVSALTDELDIEFVLQYLDLEALLETIDTEGLIAQIKALPNLQDYVLDFDALMGYIEDENLEAAVKYVDTEALIADYTDDLIPLALELDAEVLAAIVDIDAVLELDGIDIASMLDLTFFGLVISYSDLVYFDGDGDGAPDYMDHHAFIDYIHRFYSDEEFSDVLHEYYVRRDYMKELLEDHEHDLEPYMDMGNLQSMLAGKTYSDVQDYVKINATLFNMVSDAIESNPNYVIKENAKAVLENLVNAGEIDLADLGGDLDNIDYAEVFRSDVMSSDIYEDLIAGDALDMNAMVISADAPLNIQNLNNAGIFELDLMLNTDPDFNIDRLEDAKVIDLNKVIFGDEEAGLDPFDSDLLLKYKVLNMDGMLSGTAERPEPLFEIVDLVRDDIIHDEALASKYGYDNMILDAELKRQVKALPDTSVLADCIDDTVGAIQAVGVPAAVDATCGSYGVLINNYVTDVAAMMDVLGVDAVIAQIIEDDMLDTILDVEGVVRALGIVTLIRLVDLQLVITQLRESGGLQAIVKSIDPEKYISALTSTLGVLEKNISEIKVNDVVITKKDGNLLFIDTASLFVLLEDFVPQVEDIANIGDDGKVFSVSLAIKYKSDNTNNVEKTKEITVNAVLASGVEQVRKAAQKLQSILDKYFVYDFKDGILSLDLRIPGKFATAMKLALEKLETTGDSDLQALKDELLTIFNMNVSDAGAFVNNFTLAQIVDLLELVDSSKFSVAYSKIIANQYVQTLLDYISEATGLEYNDLSLDDLLLTATDLPTLEELCERIESKLGREIEAFDKLPTGDPVEILQRLANKAGVDADLKQILKDAAKQDDPLKYLYDTAVSIIENNENAYEAIKSRVINVIDKVLASNLGQKLGTLSLSDFYVESGVFELVKSVEIEPITLLNKGVQKLIEVVASKVDFDMTLVDRVADIILSYFTDDTVKLGVDVTTRFNGLYKAVFYDENGDEILTTLLPEGADLALMMDYTPLNPEDVLEGWKALTSDDHYEEMPAKDIGLIADVGKLQIIVIDPDDDTKLVGIIPVAIGDTPADYADELNALVKSYLKNNALADDEIVWLNHQDRVELDMNASIESNLYVTWRLNIQHTVTIVDPDTDELVHEFTVQDGETLEDYLAEMIAKVKDHLEDDTIADEDIIWMYEDAEYDITTPVTSDLTLTWEIEETVLPTYTVTIVDPDLATLEVHSFPVTEGDTLSEYLTEMNDSVRDYLDDDTIADEDISWLHSDGTACDLDAAIVSDLTLTWEIEEDDEPEQVTVTVVDPEDNDAVVHTIDDLVEGDVLNADQLAEMLAKVNEYLGTNYTADQIVWKNLDGTDFNVSAEINANVIITWAITQTPDIETVTVTVVNRENPDEVLYETTVIKGGRLNSTDLDAMNALQQLKEQNPSDEMHVYHHAWHDADDASKAVLNLNTLSITADMTLTWTYVEDKDAVALRIVDAIRGQHYYITSDANNWIVVWTDEWRGVLELDIDAEFYSNTKKNLIVQSETSVHQFVFPKELLVKVGAAAVAAEIADVSIHYEENKGADQFNYAADSGAVYFTLGFYFGGFDDGTETSVGDFGENKVVITMPFTGASKTMDKKTFVTIGTDEVEIEDNYTESSVTFMAPHFSPFAIVNKYNVYHADAPDTSMLPDGFPTELIPTANIATFPIENKYYAKGHVFNNLKVDLLDGIKGFEVVYTKVLAGAPTATDATVLEKLYANGSFVMPDGAITLQHVIDIRVYYVFYYINSKLDSLDSYTMLESLPALKALPDGYAAEDGWSWSGYNTALKDQADIYVYLVNDKGEADKSFTVNFLDADGNKIADPITKTVREWADLSGFPTVAAVLKLTDADATKAGYWAVKTGGAEKRVNDLTTAEWNAILAGGTSVDVYVQYSDRDYTVYTDGNATVENISASVGETVEVVIRKELGKTATVIVQNLNDATDKIVFTFAEGSDVNGSFVMPAADVAIEVVYTATTISYIDANGKTQTGAYGDTNELPAIIIPEGMTLDATKFTNIPNGLVLTSSSMDENRNLILVYSYVLIDNTVNEQAFIAAVKASAIKELVYQSVYVLNGKTFDNEDAALATLTGSATFKNWSKSFGKNLNFAAFNLASENLEPTLLILCIVLVVLILILLIALFYILYITGKLKPNWFLKMITAIVSAFYAVCMAVAAAGLAIARLFGYREDELVETPEEINARLAAEAAEESVEEAAEEPTEEAVEEVPEAVVEDVTAELSEETAEETGEDHVEETAEDDAVATVVEETIEEAAQDDAIDVVVEDAVEEATVETTEEATEAVAEEAVEGMTEEVTEKTTEAVAEEVVEDTTEEASEEATEETTEEEVTADADEKKE